MSLEQDIKTAASKIKALSSVPVDNVIQAVVLAALAGRNCVEGSGNVIEEDEMTRLCEYVGEVMTNVMKLSLVIDQKLAVFAGEGIEFSLTDEGREELWK